jgi:uncharacterized protein (TIGR02001 family)
MYRKRIIVLDLKNRSHTLLLCVAGGVFALASVDALSQVSGNVVLISDYRFRGVSLSDGQAEPQVNLGYDGPSGWYAGVSGSGVELREGRDQQLIAYAGYSHKLASSLTWELGVTNSAFLKTAGYHYAEAYAGLSFDEIGGRIYVSPNYFGQSMRTAYVEVNASHLIADRTHLLAHIGYLRSLSEADGSAFVPFSRFDALVGASASRGDWRLQLAWVAAIRTRAKYPLYGARNSRALVLSASYSF